jgi:hypothetical protein
MGRSPYTQEVLSLTVSKHLNGPHIQPPISSKVPHSLLLDVGIVSPIGGVLLVCEEVEADGEGTFRCHTTGKRREQKVSL